MMLVSWQLYEGEEEKKIAAAAAAAVAVVWNYSRVDGMGRLGSTG